MRIGIVLVSERLREGAVVVDRRGWPIQLVPRFGPGVSAAHYLDNVAVRVVLVRDDNRAGIGDLRRPIQLVVAVCGHVAVSVAPGRGVPVPIVCESGVVSSGPRLVDPPAVRV